MSATRRHGRKHALPAVFTPASASPPASAHRKPTVRRKRQARPRTPSITVVLAGGEAMAAVRGLALAAQSGDARARGAALGAIEKILTAAPVEFRDRLRDLAAEAASPESVDDPDELLAIVDDAIRDERKLRIVYFDTSGQQSTRTIKPLAWAKSRSGDSIAAWCELRGDFRHFRVDRIEGIAVIDAYFRGERDALLDLYLR